MILEVQMYNSYFPRRVMGIALGYNEKPLIQHHPVRKTNLNISLHFLFTMGYFPTQY